MRGEARLVRKGEAFSSRGAGLRPEKGIAGRELKL